MDWLKKAVEFVDYNRWLVVGFIAGVLVMAGGLSCEPLTESPTNPQKLVDAKELQTDFARWQADQQIIAAQFEQAGEDLKSQQEAQDKITKFLLDIASGAAVDWQAGLQLVLAGGGLGAIVDNIRKRGVIAGLKKNA